MKLFITHTAMDDGTFPAPTVTRVLVGHVSPETAYAVGGAGHWLEFNPKRGLRWIYRSSGGKLDKATFCEFGCALYLDGNGRVQCSAPLVGNFRGSYKEGDEVIRDAWWKVFGVGVPEVARCLKDNPACPKDITPLGSAVTSVRTEM
jgi:hypothetical protein